MNFDKFSEYSTIQHLVAIGVLGLVFILLGWLVSRLFRPGAKLVQQELHDIKKELLAELNTAKKFNAEYQLLIKKDNKSIDETPEVKES